MNTNIDVKKLLPYILVLLTSSDVCILHKENETWEKFSTEVKEGRWWNDLVIDI